jgi:hypothetical protein
MYISPVGCFVAGIAVGIVITLVTIVVIALAVSNKGDE